MRFSTTPDLLRAVHSDAQLEADFKANPVATLARVTQPNPLPKTWLYRLVFLTFALSLLAAAGNHKPQLSTSEHRP